MGSHNKRTYTGWTINNRNLYLTVKESENCKIRSLADSVSGENSLRRLTDFLFSVSSRGRRGERSLWGLGVGPREISGRSLLPLLPLLPLMKTLPSRADHLPKAPPPNPIALGLGTNISILEGHKRSVYGRTLKNCMTVREHTKILTVDISEQ